MYMIYLRIKAQSASEKCKRIVGRERQKSLLLQLSKLQNIMKNVNYNKR